VATIEQTRGPATVLVNNTGGPSPGPIEGVPRAEWQGHFASMVMPVVSLTDRVLPGMRAAGWGRVITSASSGVVAPIPNLGLSNSLRSALVGWSKTLASEVAGHGITVNVVLPGRIATQRILSLDRSRAERDAMSTRSRRRASTRSRWVATAARRSTAPSSRS
jgi:3-oxoacyl-[acyl-carrier protein] reductase